MNIYVHTPTLENYIEVVTGCLRSGCKWKCGDKYIHEEYWSWTEEDICLHINDSILTFSTCVLAPHYIGVSEFRSKYGSLKDFI